VKQQQSPCDLKPHDWQTVLSKDAQVGNDVFDVEQRFAVHGCRPLIPLTFPHGNAKFLHSSHLGVTYRYSCRRRRRRVTRNGGLEQDSTGCPGTQAEGVEPLLRAFRVFRKRNASPPYKAAFRKGVITVVVVFEGSSQNGHVT
jgi:hypothetical protein